MNDILRIARLRIALQRAFLGRAILRVILVRNDQKGRLLVMEPVHCGSYSILKVRFFWDTL